VIDCAWGRGWGWEVRGVGGGVYVVDEVGREGVGVLDLGKGGLEGGWGRRHRSLCKRGGRGEWGEETLRLR